MDLNKLTQGDQIIGVSGIVLFVISFFNWLGATASVGGSRSLPGGFSASGADTAWGFTLTLIAVLLGLALLAYVVLKAVGVEMPSNFGSVTLAQVVLGVAAVAFLFVLIKLIAGPNLNTGSFGGVTVSKTRKFGIYVGLLATIGLVVGAFLNVRAEQSSSSPPSA
jgi:uncharacterized membrane protein